MPGQPELQLDIPQNNSGGILYHAKARRHSNTYALQQMYYQYLVTGVWGYNIYHNELKRQVGNYKKCFPKEKKVKLSKTHERRGGFLVKKFVNKQPTPYYQHKRYKNRNNNLK